MDHRDHVELIRAGVGGGTTWADKARGVRFEDYDFPGLTTVDQIGWIGPERAAWFRDSEGNILSVSEPWRASGDAVG